MKNKTPRMWVKKHHPVWELGCTECTWRANHDSWTQALETALLLGCPNHGRMKPGE